MIHGDEPFPTQGAEETIDAERQGEPLTLPLTNLPDIYAGRHDHTGQGAMQRNTDFISEADPVIRCDAFGQQSRRQAPFFHTSCRSRSAWGARGRGITACRFKRSNTLRMPQYV